MKKIVLSVLVAVLASALFAQEVTVAFENKLSSDVVTIEDKAADFAGIKNKVTAEVESEKVDVGLSFIAEFAKNNDGTLGFTEYELDTAYIEFRPIEKLSLDFNRKVFTPGSYLPIADDNVGNGNIAGEFSVLLRPIENLSLAAGLQLPSVFAEAEDKYDLNAGIDYTNDLFSFGAALRTPINNLGFGVFASVTAVENLTVNLGFAYNDEFCDVAGNLLTLGATYEFSICSFAFDFVTNFGAEGTDLYTALCVETAITENFILETQAAMNMEFADTSVEVIPEIGAAYVNGNHKLRIGVAVDITDTAAISFPVYYKYSF